MIRFSVLFSFLMVQPFGRPVIYFPYDKDIKHIIAALINIIMYTI